MMAANVLIVVGVVVVEFFDDVAAGDPWTMSRFVAFGLTVGGVLVLSLASLMFSMSQRTDCSFFEMKRQAFRIRARKLDEALIALPVLAFAAGCMVAGGMGMFAARLSSPIAIGIMAGLISVFFVQTARMIAATTRFMYTHAREQSDAAARARSEAAESQIAVLQAQMNPHFLFNTLNTVASLVRTDTAAAEATVENLAVVLRRTLDRSERISLDGRRRDRLRRRLHLGGQAALRGPAAGALGRGSAGARLHVCPPWPSSRWWRTVSSTASALVSKAGHCTSGCTSRRRTARRRTRSGWRRRAPQGRGW